MPNITVKFENNISKMIQAAAGENLLAVCVDNGIDIDAPCAGSGVCGKCRIKLIEGDIRMEPSIHLPQSDYELGWRLACQSEIIDDVTILIPDEASAYKNGMKVADLSSKEELKIFDKCKEDIASAGIKMDINMSLVDAQLDEPTLDDTMPDNERLICAISDKIGIDKVRISLTALKELPDMMRNSNYNIRCIIRNIDSEAIIYHIGDASHDMHICSLAIDIGTTTVSAVLIDVMSGDILAKASAGNSQIKFGADVIHRIIEQEKEGGIKKLQDAILRDTIDPMIKAMCDSSHIDKDMIIRAVISSNSTMNHLFLGISAMYLRREPYIPAFYNIQDLSASDIALPINPSASIHIMPNIGSYVGGDITSGTFASMIWNSDQMSLFIDLGTNGELVFGNRDFMISCACSAGPAFEGGDISCGMRATDGAIEACMIDKDTMEPTFTVIGNISPIGICGSGIIDTIAELFRCGIINAKGKFIRDGKRVAYDEHGEGRYICATYEDRQVCLTEADIDNFIRAKGAIFSAIQTMVSYIDCDISAIERVLVAGGIGSGINMHNAVRIGMFPDIDIDKFSYVGNTSLEGAYAAALSDEASDKILEISHNMTYLELSVVPGYMDSFVASCFLPHTDTSLFPSVMEEIDG